MGESDSVDPCHCAPCERFTTQGRSAGFLGAIRVPGGVVMSYFYVTNKWIKS